MPHTARISATAATAHGHRAVPAGPPGLPVLAFAVGTLRLLLLGPLDLGLQALPELLGVGLPESVHPAVEDRTVVRAARDVDRTHRAVPQLLADLPNQRVAAGRHPVVFDLPAPPRVAQPLPGRQLAQPPQQLGGGGGILVRILHGVLLTRPTAWRAPCPAAAADSPGCRRGRPFRAASSWSVRPAPRPGAAARNTRGSSPPPRRPRSRRWRRR